MSGNYKEYIHYYKEEERAGDGNIVDILDTLILRSSVCLCNKGSRNLEHTQIHKQSAASWLMCESYFDRSTF